MSKSQHEKLLAQLNTPDKPKVRAKACQKLAATRDPAVIPALRKIYEQDSDETVRAAAYDALVQFKTMQAKTGRSPVDRLLRTLLTLLVLIFIVSLVLNGLSIMNQDDDGEKAQAGFVPLNVTDRNELIQLAGSKLSEGTSLASSLRNEINDYNTTGQVDCTSIPNYTSPSLIELSADDEYTYPDIRLISVTFNAVQPKFEITLKLFENACLNPNDQTNSVIKAAQRLDEVDAQLNEVNNLLFQAINNPAPTVGPTVTPVPTLVPPTQTPAATLPIESASNPDEATDATPQDAVALPTATFTPQPSPTLPLPNLDYASILADINGRLTQDFLFDLQNPYGTGMLDQWQQAASSVGQTTTNYCTLTAIWPEAFTLSDEQQAQLAVTGVADPQLTEAVQLQEEAFALAQQARGLYERDCGTSSLAQSADTGIELLTEAVTKLERVQELVSEIAARP